MTRETFIYGLNACAVTYHNGQKFYEHDDLVKCFEDLGLLEQAPFMNKLCVAHQVCHEDKVKVLDKIRANILFIKDKCLPNTIAEEYEQKGLQEALDIIDKYKAEREEWA